MTINIKRNILIIISAVIIAMGFMTIPVEAAQTAPAKPVVRSVKATSPTSVTVKWKKVSGASGYIVYRNGKTVVTTSAKADTFVQRGLKPGTNYWYRVRAYKNYTVRQYYNTKTRKWQNKQPERKYNGGVKLTLARKFGAVTGATKVTTKKAVLPKPSGGTTPTTPKDNSINTKYGKIYPNADGSFNIRQGSSYDIISPVEINGVIVSGNDIPSIFSGGTVFYVDATSLDNAWLPYDSVSSNEAVAFSLKPDYLKPSATAAYIKPTMGMHFANTGTTSISVGGKTFTFIVTKANANNAKFINTVHNIEANAQGLYGYEKVNYYVEYIHNNYTYPYPAYEHNAYDMVIKGTGDCWAGNGFLAYLCGRAGISVYIRDASSDKGAGSGHRNCVITINGTKYIGDATPKANWMNTYYGLKTWDEYFANH